MSKLDQPKPPNNTKEHLSQLLVFLKKNYFILEDDILPLLELLELASKTMYVFSGKETLAIAIRSLSNADRFLANENGCDMIVIQTARSRLIAAIVYALDLDKSQLNKRQLGYWNFINNHTPLIKKREIEFTIELEKLRIFNTLVTSFLSQFIRGIRTEEIFSSVGITLDKNSAFNYTRAARYFTNPENSLWKGFPNVLRRYIFAKVVKSNLGEALSQEISHLNELQFNRYNPLYRKLAYIKAFYNAGNIVEEINQLANYIANEGNPSDLGTNYSVLANYIFCIFLTKNYRLDSNDYLKILESSPNELITVLRKDVFRIEDPKEG